MWRNILGHALFQIIILAGIIFFVPGNGLTEAYWSKCTKGSVAGNNCKLNPYFTNELYYTGASKIYWDR
jgi:hypothetical protein